MTDNRLPKPCPFCGRKVVWLKHVEDGTPKGIWMIECPECEATGPKADNENEAICGWSMRMERVTA